MEDFGLGADVVRAAQDEGKLVLASRMTEQIFGELKRTFEDRYGIEVQLESPGAAEAVERVRTEARTNQEPSYDAVILGAFAPEQLAGDGLLAPFAPSEFADTTLLEAESEFYFPLFTNVYGIAVNREVVDDDQVPTSWADLADIDPGIPVLQDDPNASAGFVWFVTMLDDPDFGESYMRGLGAVDQLRIGNVLADNISQVVRGEVGIYFAAGAFHIINDFEGTDVDFISPSEGPVLIPIYAGVVEGARNENAAKLWLSFLWSKEAQEMISQGGQAPARNDAKASDPRWDISGEDPVHQVTNQHQLDQLKIVGDGLPAKLGIG